LLNNMTYNIPVDDFLTEDELNLPEAGKVTKKERHEYWRSGRKSEYHPVNDMSPWKRIDKILKRYVGRPFDDAFSYYCKEVPKYQQHIFLDYFKPSFYRWREAYYIDDDGLIQKTIDKRNEPKKVIFESIDFKTELRHKVTGKKKPDYSWSYPFNHNNYKTKYPRAKSYYEALNFYEKEFEPIIIQGWAKEFESKKDPEYKRLMAEKRKHIERSHKEHIKELKAKEYAFEHATPEQKAREQFENRLKIRKKGFDPDTSFHKDPE